MANAQMNTVAASSSRSDAITATHAESGKNAPATSFEALLSAGLQSLPTQPASPNDADPAAADSAAAAVAQSDPVDPHLVSAFLSTQVAVSEVLPPDGWFPEQREARTTTTTNRSFAAGLLPADAKQASAAANQLHPSPSDQTPAGVGLRSDPEPEFGLAVAENLSSGRVTNGPADISSITPMATAPDAAAGTVARTHAALRPELPGLYEVRPTINAAGWDKAFTQQVLLAVGRKEQTAEIRLYPPQLGPVEVTITLSGDDGKQATVHFVSQHVAVREAIESALPRLKEVLGNAGIELGHSSVGAETSGREAPTQPRQSSGASARAHGVPDAAGEPIPGKSGAAGRSHVDIFV